MVEEEEGSASRAMCLCLRVRAEVKHALLLTACRAWTCCMCKRGVGGHFPARSGGIPCLGTVADTILNVCGSARPLFHAGCHVLGLLSAMTCFSSSRILKTSTPCRLPCKLCQVHVWLIDFGCMHVGGIFKNVYISNVLYCLTFCFFLCRNVRTQTVPERNGMTWRRDKGRRDRGLRLPILWPPPQALAPPRGRTACAFYCVCVCLYVCI